MIINEATRRELLTSSKANNKLARYSSRLMVKNVSITRVGILELMYLDQPDLDIYFDVNKSYRVSLKLLNFMDNLRSIYKTSFDKIKSEGGISNSKTLRKIVEISLNNSLNEKDIRVSCSCPDFQYRFAYVATINGYQFEEPQLIPAKVRNPNNQGSACKHVIRVLSRPSQWKAKVVTGILSVLRIRPELLTL